MGDHNADGTSGDDSSGDTVALLSWFTPARRRLVYAILVALLPILVARGVISGDEADLWQNLAMAALVGGGGALALVHTPREKP